MKENVIGSENNICKNEKEILTAIKRHRKKIYAYIDVLVSSRTARKIRKKKILIMGCKREEK